MKNKDFQSFFKIPFKEEQKEGFNFFPEVGSVTGVSAFMDYHRKNLQTLAMVQQMILDGMQVITRSSCHMISNIVESQADLVHTVSHANPGDENADDQVLILKDILNNAATHFYEISDIAHQSSRGTADVVRARLSDSLTDLQKIAVHLRRGRRVR